MRGVTVTRGGCVQKAGALDSGGVVAVNGVRRSDRVTVSKQNCGTELQTIPDGV